MAQYPYQQQPQGYYPPPAPLTTSTWAILSLISGILGWLGLFGLGGLAAVIFGHVAKGEINRGGGAVGGSGLASWGLVLGYINLALSLVGLCLAMLIITGSLAAPACLIPFMNDFASTFSTIP